MSAHTHTSHAGHDHHHHAPPTLGGGKAFAIAVGLNVAFTIGEFIAGTLIGSIALVADAGHNLSDVLALILAWIASVLATRAPSVRYTYGLKSSSILAAIANAALLWVAVGGILFETIRRFSDPAPVAGGLVMAVAAGGILVNGISALLFAKGSKSDLNLRAAFLHLMADAAVSAAVVIAGLLIVWTGKTWIDPTTSLLVTAVIAISSWGLTKDALHMGMLGVPTDVSLPDVREYLENLPGVLRVHDLHVWPMSTTETALTAHLVMSSIPADDAFLQSVVHTLNRQFGIGHPTIQIEMGAFACALEDEHTV